MKMVKKKRLKLLHQSVMFQISLKRLKYGNGLVLASASRSFTGYKNLSKSSQETQELVKLDSGVKLGDKHATTTLQRVTLKPRKIQIDHPRWRLRVQVSTNPLIG